MLIDRRSYYVLTGSVRINVRLREIRGRSGRPNTDIRSTYLAHHFYSSTSLPYTKT